MLLYLTIVLQIKLARDQTVNGVDVTFENASQLTNASALKISEFLLDSLRPGPQQAPQTRTLKDFAENLDFLARTDKLNGPRNAPNFNCFDAISGLYHSLSQLWHHELKSVLDTWDDSSSGKSKSILAEREVMCKRSGRPVMNVRGKIGMHLDYWMHRYSLVDDTRRNGPIIQSSFDCELPSEIYSMRIECEIMDGTSMYSPVRISDSWVDSAKVEKAEHPDDVFNAGINWLDPPPTYLDETASQGDPLAVEPDAHKQLPKIRFVAKLDPPLAVPHNAAVEIYNIANATLPHNDLLSIVTYQNLILGLGNVDQMYLASHPTPLPVVNVSEETKGPPRPGQPVKKRTHEHTFYPTQWEHGYLLREIPFAHPKQLVQCLPVGIVLSTHNSL
jgi:hypothetical protein